MSETPAIVAESLSKRFRIYARTWHRPLEWLSLGNARLHDDFWAVRDVSFAMPRGQCLGVIGPNGSGKSTLLKMIAGALVPTAGRIDVRGRVLSLIELSAGLDPNLTGRRNIRTLASLLDFPRGYADEAMPRIEAFADIGPFFDRPVRLYSTGMRVRLGFAMFACFKPDVFLIDEALAVGDARFQQRCAARIREMLAQGTTMMFVSHDTAAVLALCQQAIVLNQGQVVYAGEPAAAVARYFTLLGSPGAQLASKWGSNRADSPNGDPPPRTPSRADEPAPFEPSTSKWIRAHDVLTADAERHGVGGLRITAACVTDHRNSPTNTIPLGEVLAVHVLIEAQSGIPRPRAGLALHDRLGTHVFSAGTDQVNCRLPPLRAGDSLVVRFELTMNIKPGPYTLSLSTSEPGDGPNAHAGFCDHVSGLGPIHVAPPAGGHLPFFGLARLPMRCDFTRSRENTSDDA